MAKSLYKSAFGAGITSGKYKASMYDVSSLEQQRSLEGKQLEIESEKLNRQLTNITSALSLASTAAGRYTDIKDDISTLETKFGEMEQPDTIFKKLMQGAKIGLGVGEYKFGDTSIKARDFASEVKKIEYKSMLQEVEESMAIPEPVKRPTLSVASEDPKKNPDNYNIKEVIKRQREQKAYAAKLQKEAIDYYKSIETNKPQSSFEEIFKLEREKQGIGGFFEYEGKKYTTNYDWESWIA